ncbi:chloramphenicol phosphotransferase CPT family protein [Horticoccus luteus]|uniref:Chloramphenicol phosphotransferase CPT family protein n=1 Tax=Horticoccus luteus TaxID=2862869 RepID=A0A8F9XH79_9BACT|nr:chloramphenicol phosphotransferase CPT family protein [Horticoccus luteus]QYM80002.1 chloramphenicol phosphotransferase CPT family protein [Horticoccus luteus]
MKRYPVIFLNGTSSAGKTTVAQAFQKLWHEPTLYASNDAFIFMFPEHVLKDDQVRPKVLWPVLSAFNRSLTYLAACGFPLVVDYMLEAEQWLLECVDSLAAHDVLFVGVKCPLEELERRERARGDRQIGFARWQYERVHRFGGYDFEIDTKALSPDQCAEQLRNLLLSGRTGDAFARFRQSGINTA